MNKTEYISVINEVLENENYYILDSIFKEYNSLTDEKAIELLAYTFESDMLIKNKLSLAHNFYHYWQQLNKHYDSFNSDLRALITEAIKNIKTWNRQIEPVILSICQKETSNFNETQKLDFYIEHLEYLLMQNFISKEINDKDIINLWFITKIIQENDVFLNQLDNVTFDFTAASYDKLISALNDKHTKLMFSNYEFLLKHTSVNLLHYVLENSKLTYNKSEMLPDSFYENKLVQRVFVNIDRRGINIEPSILNILRGSIEFEYKFYGTEMNAFVKKHNFRTEVSDNYYIDGIGPIISGKVKQMPYVTINTLASIESVNQLIDVLKMNSKKESSLTSDNIFTEISVEGQTKELITKLNTEENWRNNKNNLIFLNKLIDIKNLRELYEEVIVRMLVYGISNQHIGGEDADKYLRAKDFKNNQKINYYDKLLLLILVEHGKDGKQFVYEILFDTISPRMLSTKSIFTDSQDNSQWIILDEFINTDLGRYYSIIENISEKTINNNFRDKLREGIILCESKYKDYLKGMFINHFPELDSENTTANTFIGYSHNYIMNRQYNLINLFVNSAIGLFESEISDNYILTNMATILVEKVDPIELNFKYEENYSKYRNQLLLIIMENFIVDDLFRNKYYAKWFRWFLNVNKSNKVFVRHLLLNFSQIECSKINVLISNLDTYMSVDDPKIEDYQFSYIHSIETYTENQFKLLINLISVILSKQLITITYYFIEGMEDIFNQLKIKQYNNLSEKLFAAISDYLLPTDSQKLKDKYIE